MESVEAERRKQQELQAKKREEDFAIGWLKPAWKTTGWIEIELSGWM